MPHNFTNFPYQSCNITDNPSPTSRVLPVEHKCLNDRCTVILWHVYLLEIRKESTDTGQSWWPTVFSVNLRPLNCWDCGFESRRGHGCCLVFVVCHVGSGLYDELITCSGEYSLSLSLYVCVRACVCERERERDVETSMRWPRQRCVTGGKKRHYKMSA